MFINSNYMFRRFRFTYPLLMGRARFWFHYETKRLQRTHNFSILQRGKFPTEHMLISYRGFTRFAKQLTRTLFFPEENPECNNPVFNPHRKRCFSIK